MQSAIDHPRWDASWAVPDKRTIDDLGEMQILRVNDSSGNERTFVMTMQGRQEAAALVEQVTTPILIVGPRRRHPRYCAGSSPSRLRNSRFSDDPKRLLDRAVDDGIIGDDGRESLARRILGLIEQGYVRGDVPLLSLGTARQRLSGATSLELAVSAEQALSDRGDSGPVVTIIGDVINSQLAAGDIANYVTFNDVLDQAYAEVLALEDIEPADREAAKGLIDRLRGKAIIATGDIMTGAGGATASVESVRPSRRGKRAS